MDAGAFVATLPMYDWPEVRAANDELWNCLRVSLRDHGFPAPERLERGEPADDLWRSRNLVLGQTCGLPFVRDLMQTVSVVGTPSYEIECGAGSYFSAIVVRNDSDIEDIADLKGRRLAYNSPCSQSGYAGLAYHLRDLAGDAPIFSEKIQSGSHRESVRMIAGDKADVAAIDAVAWRLAQRHEPAASGLRVLALTEPLPGLPMICARNNGWSVDRMHLAVVEAMATLEPDIADALLLNGFAPYSESDYSVIARRAERAQGVAL
ncbi:phosphate/phosphite/phosphonate ABC transporter substrate-binding protein [Hoeflea sp.]|uniref:phosphate/phosphite/phosphonate ABC transporter substrate-binding protein n=1 Tax=Hoeflea sp. TaxID=1940281 RepID=UPI003B029ED6